MRILIGRERSFTSKMNTRSHPDLPENRGEQGWKKGRRRRVAMPWYGTTMPQAGPNAG